MRIEKNILKKIYKAEDEKITEESIELVYKFLKDHIYGYRIKSINKNYTSYEIKHHLQRILKTYTGNKHFYVSNLDVKYCMELLGVKSCNDNDTNINYCYSLSESWFYKLDHLAR